MLAALSVQPLTVPSRLRGVMTNVFKRWEIELRLKLMVIQVKWSDDSKLDDQINSLLSR